MYEFLKHPVVVLGANGFIGQHLTRMIPGALPITRGSPIDYKYPKTIFNVAGYSGNDPNRLMEDNVYLVTDWLRNMNKDAIFINAGSSMEYKETHRPTENMISEGRGLYGKSKSLASCLIGIHGAMGIPCANLRLYCVYGAWDRPTNLLPTVIRSGKQGELPPFVKGFTTRDFVHVSDVCRAFIIAALKLRPENYGESFNIGTGIPTSIDKVASIASQIFNVKPEFTRDMGENDSEWWYADTTKSRKILGFSTEISFEDGFRELATS